MRVCRNGSEREGDNSVNIKIKWQGLEVESVSLSGITKLLPWITLKPKCLSYTI